MAFRATFQRLIRAVIPGWREFTRAAGPSTRDREQPRLRLADITPSTLNAALDAATRGDLNRVGRIWELMPATDPVIFGAVNQLRSAIARIEWDVLPAGAGNPLALEISTEIRDRLADPDVRFGVLTQAAVDAYLDGYAAVEVLWNPPVENPHRWTKFEKVHFQKLRVDTKTGQVGYAESPSDQKGTSFSTFAPGKFLVFQPDGVTDPANAGAYRPILWDWFARRNAAAWYSSRLERWGTPGLVGKLAHAEEQESFLSFARSFGSDWAVAVSKDSDVQTVEMKAATPSLFREHDEMSRANIAIAILGATQSVAIDQGTGSKASASVHEGVKRELAEAIWGHLSEVLREQLFAPYVAVRWGMSALSMVPKLQASFEDPIDLKAIADGIAAAQAAGIAVTEDWASDATGIPAPGAGEAVLKPAVQPAAAFARLNDREATAAAPDAITSLLRAIPDDLTPAQLSALRWRLGQLSPMPVKRADELASQFVSSMYDGLAEAMDNAA